jgi:hypothetical protein
LNRRRIRACSASDWFHLADLDDPDFLADLARTTAAALEGRTQTLIRRNLAHGLASDIIRLRRRNTHSVRAMIEPPGSKSSTNA